MTKKFEESGFKEKFQEGTSTLVNKGLELSVDAYLRTSDKIIELNVSFGKYSNTM
jgi:hypothetical protein